MIIKKPFISLLLFTAAMTGCVSFSREYPEIRLYQFDPGSNEVTAKTDEGPVVTLRNFTASPGCADSNFLLKRSGNRVEKDYYNRFVEEPADLLFVETATWLRDGSAFSEVRTFAVDNDSDWTLSGHLLRLEGDFGVDPPVALLAIQFYLMPEEAEETKHFFRTYEKEVALQKATPDALVEGWNLALAGILQEFEGDLNDHLLTE